MEEPASKSIVQSCRAVLRIPDDCLLFDEEIADLISAARSALIAGGVCPDLAQSDEDPSVRVALKTYVKANFGLDNPDSDRLMHAFSEMLCRMAGSRKYADECEVKSHE